MSQADLELRFDGPDVEAHAMDVCVLAPSLMAFGELCTEANRVLNGNNAKVKVLLKADVKANCVTVEFQIVQTLWQHVGNLIGNQNVANAKEILEWIGIISGSGVFAAGAVKGLIEYLRWKKDRKETSAEIRQTINGNIVIVKVEGDNNTITLPEQTYKLSKSVKVIESIKVVAQPVSEEQGIEKATFIYNKKEELKIDKACANELKAAHADGEETEPQTFTAHIVTYGPIFDPKSKHWKFKMNNRVENLDISETKIAEDALARGGVSVGDTYKAKIEMTERMTKQGDYKTEFKVKEILDFSPGVRRQQTELFDKSLGSQDEPS
jgi:hypothetical protein